MPGAELRTYVLGAVVSVLAGACIGFGWYYLADSAGATTMSSVLTPLAKQDTSSPALSCPPGPREDPGLDIPRPPVLSRLNNQPGRTNAKGGLSVTNHRIHQPRRTAARPRPD